MRKIVFILSFLAVALSSSADINEYTVEVGEFSKLKVINDIDVVYKCVPDSAGKAVFVAEDSLADAYLFTNKNGTLKIEKYTDFATVEVPQVTVYSNFLTSVENSSQKNVEVVSVASCPEFSVKQIGNGSVTVDNIEATKVNAKVATGKGRITIQGECTRVSLSMVGTGTIQADSLEADEVSCSVFGTGSIGCWPVDKLSVKGLASTTVYYRGTPKTIKKTGFAKVEPLK